MKAIRDPSSGGRGLIYPDTFADEGLGFLPPAVGALIVVFNRNHNYIAGQILKLNEKKKWLPYPISDAAKAMEQDDEIFETARHIKSVLTSFSPCLSLITLFRSAVAISFP